MIPSSQNPNETSLSNINSKSLKYKKPNAA